MQDLDTIKAIVSSFPEVTEEPHFEKTSFRVRKKIFCTYDDKDRIAVIKLSSVDQHVFSSAPGNAIYAVPNKWGNQGWTCIVLQKVKKALLRDALTTAYCEVAPKKLAFIVRPPHKNP